MFYKKDIGEAEDLAAGKGHKPPKTKGIVSEEIDDDNMISGIEVDEDEEGADVDSSDFDKNADVHLKGKDRSLAQSAAIKDLRASSGSSNAK